MSTRTRGVPRSRRRRQAEPDPCATCATRAGAEAAARAATEAREAERTRGRRIAFLAVLVAIVLGFAMGRDSNAPRPGIRASRTVPGLTPAERQAQAEAEYDAATRAQDAPSIADLERALEGGERGPTERH